MFRDVTAVLFDLDGTLVDTIQLILSAHQHTLARYLLGPGPTEAAIIRNLGRPLHTSMREYAEADGRPDAGVLAAQMVETYREFQHEHHDRLVKGYDGVPDTLVALRERGYTLGIVTSKAQEIAMVVIDGFNLAPLVDVMVFLEDTAGHKPEPDPLLEAARRGGFDPGRGLYVGDSIHDIAAGRAAGMKTAGALWGPFDRADLDAAGPDCLLASPRDLLTLLPGIRHSSGSWNPGQAGSRPPRTTGTVVPLDASLRWHDEG